MKYARTSGIKPGAANARLRAGRSGAATAAQAESHFTRKEARQLEAKIQGRALQEQGQKQRTGGGTSKAARCRLPFGNAWKQTLAKLERAARNGEPVELTPAGTQMVLAHVSGFGFRVSGSGSKSKVPTALGRLGNKETSASPEVPAIVSRGATSGTPATGPGRRRLSVRQRRQLVELIRGGALSLRAIARTLSCQWGAPLHLRLVQYWRDRVKALGAVPIEHIDLEDRAPGALAPWNAIEPAMEALILKVRGELVTGHLPYGPAAIRAELSRKTGKQEDGEGLPERGLERVPSVRTIARVIAREGGRA